MSFYRFPNYYVIGSFIIIVINITLPPLKTKLCFIILYTYILNYFGILNLKSFIFLFHFYIKDLHPNF